MPGGPRAGDPGDGSDLTEPAPGPEGWTLHQLRHSALTHLAEAGVNLPVLMAKSGHQNLRSLQRYARPGTEAVATMTAAQPDFAF